MHFIPSEGVYRLYMRNLHYYFLSSVVLSVVHTPLDRVIDSFNISFATYKMKAIKIWQQLKTVAAATPTTLMM